jgi:hypothetical protein
MKRQRCQCGQELNFSALICPACGTTLVYRPSSRHLGSSADAHLCELREPLGCNWSVSGTDFSLGQRQCRSCRLTSDIPWQGEPRNVERWSKLEAAKRRMLDGINALNIPLPENLRFSFLEDRRSNPNALDDFIYSGHLNGVITINAAEADDIYRIQTREEMKEEYRTLLGHFRHEVGHAYWDFLIRDSTYLTAFRDLFGDERADYQTALDSHYQNGAPANWAELHISSYASSHPYEDWAETWAHYLHMTDALETAIAHGAISAPTVLTDFAERLREWRELTQLLNDLNQSVGRKEAYPFTLPPLVEKKLAFIDQVLKRN